MGAAQAEDLGPARVSLGTWPTPVERAPRLAERLGLAAGCLWIKRDDLTGLGAGGNKVRKLEYLCAAAVENGATTLVTSGGAQSNHARLTAAAACRLGLRCVAVLAGQRPEVPTGNLALEGLLGARVVWAGKVDDDGLDERVETVAEDLTRSGQRVEVIPLGGSSAIGARGYVDCGHELDAQVPDFTRVVVGVGSGGTMAGLVAALGPERVLGVDAGATADAHRRVRDLLDQLFAAGATSSAYTDGPLHLRGDQVGAGYGILTSGARTALIDAAQCEGIILDPVYTAKALSGLGAALREGSIGPDEPTVFLHSGGLPGLFGHDVLRDPQCAPETVE